MKKVMTQSGSEHEIAIARKWHDLYMQQLMAVSDENKKHKIWRVAISCTTEEQLLNWYRVVQQYTRTVAWFDIYNFKSWVICYVDRLMRWL